MNQETCAVSLSPSESEAITDETTDSGDPSGLDLFRLGDSPLDEALDFCQAAQDYWQKGEQENALEALDQAYSLIINVDTENDQRLIQQKEDLRFLISKRILEIYASRNIVVNGNHNAIPLDMNPHVQAEIDSFTKGPEREFFMAAYRRSGWYRDQIMDRLKQAGLPPELAWLPLIESGFKYNALSKARALGLWQFIPSTGYKFGLTRDTFIDERMDPEKATKAAIEYLKELHQIFGDWTTALAGYNCGEGRVLRVIREQNINYLDNFWDLYEKLPPETARYVPRFLATLHIVNNPEKYGLDGLDSETAIPWETGVVNRQVQLKDVAGLLNVSTETLKLLNPELRLGILPPENYTLRIPEGTGGLLQAGIGQLSICVPTPPAPPQKAYASHKVKKGESLSGIARKYRIPIDDLLKENRINRKGVITVGQVLKIPQKGGGSSAVAVRETPPAPTAPKAPTGKPRSHTVKSGDSLWNIARKYGTTTRLIQRLNDLSSNDLSIGQVLAIPPEGGDKPELHAARAVRYVVQAGDTPFRIASKYNMSIEDFLRLNRMTPRSKIFPGQEVTVQ